MRSMNAFNHFGVQSNFSKDFPSLNDNYNNLMSSIKFNWFVGVLSSLAQLWWCFGINYAQIIRCEYFEIPPENSSILDN